ncbi:unnamed protein product [Caenorhabditis brenneri]
MIRRLMKLLAPFAAAAIIVYVFRSDFDSTGLNVSDDRLVRAAPDDKLKDSIEKLQMVARLTNVLYLQVGLISGNVFDSEELISELLHFGAVKPKDIQELKFTEIESVLYELKTLPMKFEKGDDIKTIEDVFLKVKNILNEMDGVSKAEKWEGKADYVADLEKITNGSVKFEGDADKLKTLTRNWLSHLDGIQDNQNDPTNDNDLTGLKDKSEKLKNVALTLREKQPVLFQFKKGEKAKDAINSLVKVGNSIELLGEMYSIRDDYIDQLKAYFQPASDFVSQMKTVRPGIDVVESVHFYRLNPGLSPFLKYTPGLLEGYDDVTILNENFKDAWFNQVVKNNSIATAFPSVQSLASTMSGIQRSLDKPTPEHLEILRGISLESDKFQRFSEFPLEDAKIIAECVKDANTPSANSFITDLVALTKDIDDQFENFKKILKSSAEDVLKDQNNLESLIGELNEVDSTDLQNAYKHILSLESVKSIKTTLQDLKFDGLDTKSLIDHAKKTITKLGEFEDYEQTIKDHYVYIQCLLKNKEKAPKVIDAFDHSKNLQSQNNAFNQKIEKGVQYVKAVVNTVEGLNSLKTEITSAKGSSSSATKPLQNLNQTDAIAIGFATRAVANMKALIDRKSEFEVFKTHSNLVQSERDKHARKIQPDQWELLVGIMKLGTSLDTMYSELDTWKNAINAKTFPKLDSFSEVFKEAAKVNGLKEDLSKMTEALEKLIEIVEAEDNTSSTRRKRSINDLNEIKTALISLDSLQFSKYSSNFANSKETLSSIDMFFANYVKDLMKLLTSPIPPQRIQHVNAPGASKEDLEEIARNAEKWRWIITGICLGVLGAIVILVVVCCCCCKRRRMPCNQTIKKFTPFNVKPRVALRYLRNLKSQVDYIEKHCMVKNGPKGETANQEKARKNVFYQFCLSICTASAEGKNEKVVAPYNKLHNQMLVSKNIRPDSAIKLDATGKDTDIASTFYHGNLMIMRNLFKVILMQGAVDPSSNPGKVSTIEKLWKLAKKYKVKTIVMLSNLSEENKEGARYFARGLNDTFRVGENSEIRCNAINDHEKITTRQLEYFENKGDKNGHEVVHLQHTSWGDWQLPRTKGIRKILEQVRTSEGPVMVHCSDGLGRTGAFVYTEKLLQAIHFSKNEDGKVDHGDLLREMRETRACCIQQTENLMVPIMIVLDMFFEASSNKIINFHLETFLEN